MSDHLGHLRELVQRDLDLLAETGVAVTRMGERLRQVRRAFEDTPDTRVWAYSWLYPDEEVGRTYGVGSPQAHQMARRVGEFLAALQEKQGT